jgi:Plant mobile domain
MDSTLVPIFLYHGGSIVQGPSGYIYDGPRPSVIHTNPNITFDQLKSKIFSATGWPEEITKVDISARWQAARGGSTHFMLIPIVDNCSLKSVITNTLEGKIEWSVVELYLESSSKKSDNTGCSANDVEIVEDARASSSSTGSGADLSDLPVVRPVYPLLTMQTIHRSQAHFEGEQMEDLLIRQHKLLKWDDRYKTYIQDSGLYGIVQIGTIKVDVSLISALVERWRQETHTFHLPVGEMTVTLEDVAILLGVPVNGEPITYNTDESWEQWVNDCLGVLPDEKAWANKSALSLRWLRDKFGSLPVGASEDTIRCYVRAYLLVLFGSVLFTDLSGDSVSCLYLPLIADLDRVRSYSWASGVLAFLYKELCRACKRNSKQMAGPVFLLQMWVWERLHIGSPKVEKLKPIGNVSPEYLPPLGYKWSRHHTWKKNRSHSLSHYRNKIDMLRDEQVAWTPYEMRNVQQVLPPICTADSGFWMMTAPLLHFWIIETYHPERVMRQFARYQTVPPPIRSTIDSLHSVERRARPRENWTSHHNKYVDEWFRRNDTIMHEERAYDLTLYKTVYMKWYENATVVCFCRHLTPQTDQGSPLPDSQEQLSVEPKSESSKHVVI